MLDKDLRAENLAVIASEHPISDELLASLREHPAAWPGLQAWVDYVHATGERITVPAPTVEEARQLDEQHAPSRRRRRPGRPPRWVLVLVGFVVACAGVVGAYAAVSGRDSHEVDPVPVNTKTVAGAYASGDGFACWASGTTVDCVGANQYGQLGTGVAGAPGRYTFEAAAPVVRVVAGKSHACTLDEAGNVTCWGDNRWMQAGVAGQILTPTQVGGLGRVVDLVAGEIHTCTLDETGKVSCWGSDYHGQLASGTQGQAAQGVTVIDVPPATRLASSRFGTCAVDETGAAWCWGSNAERRLADSDEPIVAPTVLGVIGE